MSVTNYPDSEATIRKMNEPREVTCVWCGFQFESTIQSQAQHLYDHATTCAKHPVSQLVAELTTLRAERDRLRELCALCADIIDDNLENRPARHSLGNLHARLRAALSGEGVEK